MDGLMKGYVVCVYKSINDKIRANIKRKKADLSPLKKIKIPT